MWEISQKEFLGKEISNFCKNLCVKVSYFFDQNLILHVKNYVSMYGCGAAMDLEPIRVWAVMHKKKIGDTFFARIPFKLISNWFSKFCSSFTLRPDSSCPINCLHVWNVEKKSTLLTLGVMYSQSWIDHIPWTCPIITLSLVFEILS